MQAIANNEVYKKVLADSHGGVIYNVANKYDPAETRKLIKMWQDLSPGEQEAAGGIMKGVIAFLMLQY